MPPKKATKDNKKETKSEAKESTTKEKKGGNSVKVSEKHVFQYKHLNN
jgi:hypothetical protein